MLNKIEKLSLEDYLKDSTDLRLSLFATRLNPIFKLDKSTKEQLIILINDYKVNPIKLRLNAIETFVKGANQDKGLFKPKRAKDIKAGLIKETVIEKELNENAIKMGKLRDQLLSLIRMRNPYARNMQLEDQISQLQLELKPLEQALGFFDPCPPEKSKLDIIFGLFGHWDDPESLAYELFNGNKPVIQIKTNQDVKGALNDMINLSKKQMRAFYITNNELAGGVKGTKHVPMWTLVDVNSGQQPADKSFVTMVDGRVSDLDLSRIVSKPNLTAPTWSK